LCNRLNYLGPLEQNNGGFEDNVRSRAVVVWMKRRELPGILWEQEDAIEIKQ